MPDTIQVASDVLPTPRPPQGPPDRGGLPAEGAALTTPFDLLLHVCAAPADRAWVDGYLMPSLALSKGQVHTRADDRLGHPRIDEIARATTRARYTLLVLSRAFLSDGLSDYARSLATHAAAHEGRLLLVVREACKLPLQLDYLVRLECLKDAGRDEWDAEMARLRALLERPAPVAEALPCPYPGLRAYTAHEAGQFYGRAKAAARLLQRLRGGERELYVIGPSGSGKSSLVQAAVLPKLEGQAAVPFFDAPFVVRAVRPSRRPTERLWQALGATPPRPPRGAEGGPPPSGRSFDPSALGPSIDALLGAHAGAGRVLLFVDQFEELFTLAGLAERRRFFEALRALREHPRCAMVLAMRVDFAGALMDSELWPDLEDRFDPVRVAPLRGKALAEVIEAPARELGVAFEPRLVERLLADAANEPGVLPLLQETLRLLWQGRNRRLLRLRQYEALSEDGKRGLAVALASCANAAFNDLPAPERRVARRMFVRLISFGEGRPNTRRQQPKAALLALGDDEAQAVRVLEALTRARLLTTGDAEGEGDAAPDACIDLAHEALIEGWPQLAGWLSEQQEAEQTRRRLETKVDEWRLLGRGRGGLLDAEELPEFDAWLKSEAAVELGIDPAMPELVGRSHAALARQKRWRNAGITLLVAFSALVSLLAVDLYRQRALTQKSLAAAISVAHDITFDIERGLRSIAGVSALRARLLQRSHDLVKHFEDLAGEQGDAGRIRVATFVQQADLLCEQGKLPEAAALYQQAHAYFVQQAKRDPSSAKWQRDLSGSHERLGEVLTTAGKIEEARRAFEQSLAIRKTLAERDPSNAEWQHDLSIAHTKLGDVFATAGALEEARRAFEHSLVIAQTLTTQDPSNAQWQHDLSVSHERLGGVLATTGTLEEARRAFEQSLDIRQKLADKDPSNAQWQRDLSVAHIKLGDMLATTGTLEEARRAFEQGLAIGQKLAAQDPSSAVWQRDLSIAHSKLGGVLTTAGKLEAARRAFEQSLAIGQKLAAQDPSNAQWQRDLSVAHSKLGGVLATAGALEEARRAFEQSLDIRQKLAAQDPSNAQWQRDLSVAHSKLGAVLATMGTLEEAAREFRADFAIAQKLAAQDPSNAEWQRDLSISYSKLGDVLATAGTLEEARRAFEQSLDIRQKLAAQDPSNAQWQRDLSVSHSKLGEVLATTGTLEEARCAFEQSLAIGQKLAAQDSNNVLWRKDLVLSHGRLVQVGIALRRRNEAQRHYRKAIDALDVLERNGLWRGDAQMPQIRSWLEALRRQGRF